LKQEKRKRGSVAMRWQEAGWSEDMKEAARKERKAIWWEKLSDEEKRKYMERKARRRAEEERKKLEKNAKEDLKRFKKERR
jgi:hypothetical protein